jgi:hypothetical protein
MNKAQWEEQHHYRKSDHNCGFCQHCEDRGPDPYTTKCYCAQKREAGAGEKTNASYVCDLFEHR